MSVKRLSKALAALGPVLSWRQTVAKHLTPTGIPGLGCWRVVGVGWARTADGHLHVFVWEE